MPDKGRALRVRRHFRNSNRHGLKALGYGAAFLASGVGAGVTLGMGAAPVAAGLFGAGTYAGAKATNHAKAARRNVLRGRIIRMRGRTRLLRKASVSMQKRRRVSGSSRGRSTSGPRGFANPRVQAAAQRGRRSKR